MPSSSYLRSCLACLLLLWPLPVAVGATSAASRAALPTKTAAGKAEPAVRKAVGPSPEAGDVDRIHPGDTIKIQVMGHAELTMEVIVPRHGKIRFPMAGTITVSGTGPIELSDLLAARLRAGGKLVNPDVAAQIVRYASKRIFIYGAVVRAQQISIPRNQPLTISQAIAIAGGFLGSANRTQVKLIRRLAGRSPVFRIIDANRITKPAFIHEDIALMDGDTIVVGAREKVYVMGFINRPGAYTISNDSERTLVKAIGLAGGFAKGAGSNRVRLFYRDAAGRNASRTVDVKKILDRGDLAYDIPLPAGSIIHVPSRRW